MTSDSDLAGALRSSIPRLSRQLRRQHAGDAELTANQVGVLGALAQRDAMTIGELALHEKVKPPSMTRIVSTLEDAGLVRRRPHPLDGRQVLVDLTEESGRAAVPATLVSGHA